MIRPFFRLWRPEIDRERRSTLSLSAGLVDNSRGKTRVIRKLPVFPPVCPQPQRGVIRWGGNALAIAALMPGQGPPTLFMTSPPAAPAEGRPPASRADLRSPVGLGSTPRSKLGSRDALWPTLLNAFLLDSPGPLRT